MLGSGGIRSPAGSAGGMEMSLLTQKAIRGEPIDANGGFFQLCLQAGQRAASLVAFKAFENVGYADLGGYTYFSLTTFQIIERATHSRPPLIMR